jgi:hypothetical protein
MSSEAGERARRGGLRAERRETRQIGERRRPRRQSPCHNGVRGKNSKVQAAVFVYCPTAPARNFLPEVSQ